MLTTLSLNYARTKNRKAPWGVGREGDLAAIHSLRPTSDLFAATLAAAILQRSIAEKNLSATTSTLSEDFAASVLFSEILAASVLFSEILAANVFSEVLAASNQRTLAANNQRAIDGTVPSAKNSLPENRIIFPIRFGGTPTTSAS